MIEKGGHAMVDMTVWHNIATDDRTRHLGMLDGYEPGHPLVPVYLLPVPAEYADDHARACEYAFELFNIGDDPELYGTPSIHALNYRAQRNRSLSVGDVLQIGEDWYACASLGWDRIEEPRWFAIGASMHGTTSLPVETFTGSSTSRQSSSSASDRPVPPEEERVVDDEPAEDGHVGE